MAVEIGSDGHWIIDGIRQVNSAYGRPGWTPYIGNNGNWFIHGQDTGFSSRGEDGKKGVVQYPSFADFPNPGESDILYIALDSGWVYWWAVDIQEYEVALSSGIPDIEPGTNTAYVRGRDAIGRPVWKDAGTANTTPAGVLATIDQRGDIQAALNPDGGLVLLTIGELVDTSLD